MTSCCSTPLLTPYPYYTHPCAEVTQDQARNVILHQYVAVVKVLEQWARPGVGQTAVVHIPALAAALVGAYLWNPLYGYFRIDAYDSGSQQVSLSTFDLPNNVAILPGVIPSCTSFMLVDTPYYTVPPVNLAVDENYMVPMIKPRPSNPLFSDVFWSFIGTGSLEDEAITNAKIADAGSGTLFTPSFTTSLGSLTAVTAVGAYWQFGPWAIVFVSISGTVGAPSVQFATITPPIPIRSVLATTPGIVFPGIASTAPDAPLSVLKADANPLFNTLNFGYNIPSPAGSAFAMTVTYIYPTR
jgi:hypothetical protein